MGTYTTVDKVGNVLGFPTSYFGAGTTPTSTVIESFITRSEEEVERLTGHAWKSKTVTDEYLKADSQYIVGRGVAFSLKYRKVSSISKLEIWDGSSWVDWKTSKTEGRNSDYWVDYTNGIIYIVNMPTIYENNIKCTYVFGDTTVPGSVEKVTTLLSAIEILGSPEFSTVVFTENANTASSHSDKLDRWNKEIEKIIDSLKEWKVI